MDNYHLLTHERLKEFILGGKADFILKDKNKEDHINFDVREDKKSKTQSTAVYYVRFKSHHWEYIGAIRKYTILSSGKDETHINFFPIKPDKLPSEQQIIKAEIFRKLIIFIFGIGKLPSNIEVWYSGKCSVCNRTLTDPKYIALGIGPTCLDNQL